MSELDTSYNFNTADLKTESAASGAKFLQEAHDVMHSQTALAVGSIVASGLVVALGSRSELVRQAIAPIVERLAPTWRSALGSESEATTFARRLGQQDLEPPQSMFPMAYKVMNENGSSPFNHRTWPLPRQNSDGTWMPGDWVQPRGKQPWGVKPSLWVTDDPHFWLSKTKGSATVFEVEIGDAESISKWQEGNRYDFTASRARLLRPLSRDELSRLKNSTTSG